MHREEIICALIIGVLGTILGAIISPLVKDFIESTKYRIRKGRIPKIGGEWKAEFWEYYPETGKEEKTIEMVTIFQNGEKIKGESKIVGDIREFAFSGFLRKQVLFAIYDSTIPESRGEGAMCFDLSGDSKRMEGYYVGYDRDLNKVVTYRCQMNKV